MLACINPFRIYASIANIFTTPQISHSWCAISFKCKFKIFLVKHFEIKSLSSSSNKETEHKKRKKEERKKKEKVQKRLKKEKEKMLQKSHMRKGLKSTILEKNFNFIFLYESIFSPSPSFHYLNLFHHFENFLKSFGTIP
jgi:hypothetical protein